VARAGKKETPFLQAPFLKAPPRASVSGERVCGTRRAGKGLKARQKLRHFRVVLREARCFRVLISVEKNLRKFEEKFIRTHPKKRCPKRTRHTSGTRDRRRRPLNRAQVATSQVWSANGGLVSRMGPRWYWDLQPREATKADRSTPTPQAR
jgi:hypothetical protein